MSASTIEETHLRMPEAGVDSEMAVGGGVGEGAILAPPAANHQAPDLQEADRLIEGLRESYRSTATLLRALDSILARL